MFDNPYEGLRCNRCGGEMVPRSRLAPGIMRAACQNNRCVAFDKPVDPIAQQRADWESFERLKATGF
jgi:hypothetical protein